MRNGKCGKTCKSGYHIKGTVFEEKVVVEPVHKNIQQTYRSDCPHEFPALSQLQSKVQSKGHPNQTQRGGAHQDFGVSPPAVPKTYTHFRCMACPAEFTIQSELKEHFNTQHCTKEATMKETSFLDAVQQTLEKMLPSLVENAMFAIQNRTRTNLVGSNVQNMHWGLTPVNSS